MTMPAGQGAVSHVTLHMDSMPLRQVCGAPSVCNVLYSLTWQYKGIMRESSATYLNAKLSTRFCLCKHGWHPSLQPAW